MEKLADAPKFRLWRSALERNGVQIRSVEELHSVRKRNGEILFSMVKIDASDAGGTPLLPNVLLRGHFVSILTMLIEKESGKRFFLMVKQIRVADGAVHYEHPAGMLDQETDIEKVALKELEEETGLIIPKEKLIRLNEDLYYSSPGLCDEGGYFFYCETELPAREIEKFLDKQTGAPEEMEFIQTDILTEDALITKVKNANALLNYFLWKRIHSGL